MVALPMATSSAAPAHPLGKYTVKKGAITIKDWRVLSSGGKAFFLGPQGTSPKVTSPLDHPSFGTNVDANDPQKDLAAGQSETAVAASGNNVVAAWNDASGFFSGSTTSRLNLSGVAFSGDGGTTWNDLLGLANNNAKQGWFGDPTAVAIDGTHFLVGGLYLPAAFAGGQFSCHSHLQLAVDVLTVVGGNKVSMSHPIVAADGGSICDPTAAFLDKEWLSFDPTTRTLSLSYTAFAFNPPLHCGNGEIDLARATVPADPKDLGKSSFQQIVVWPEEGADCSSTPVENEGAYSTVAPNGDTYVAWERNWFTNLFNGDPFAYMKTALIPAGSPSPTTIVTASLGQPNGNGIGGVKSTDFVVIAGYNRGIGNDFPRIAYDAPAGKVLVEWNDASRHALGDIFMKSLAPDLSDNATAPINWVNDDHTSYALHFLPAISVRAGGAICSSWYDRRLSGADSAVTDVFRDCRGSPGTNTTDSRVTTGGSNWTNTSTIIIPNFGDYTDNTSTGSKTYYIWSDGRLGTPQPFADHNGA